MTAAAPPRERPAPGRVAFGPAPRPVVALALLLVLAVLGLSLRALGTARTEAARGLGRYGPEDAARARRLLSRLAAALVKMQQPDGSFHPGEDEVGQQGVHERLAASALATAALARLRESGVPLGDVALDPVLAAALGRLEAEQTDDGAIGKLAVGPEQRFFQVDATSAALYAFVTVGDVAGVAAARRAAPALAGFAKAGLRNGWSRALAAMAVGRAFEVRRGTLFPREAGRVVRGRQVGEKDSIDFQVTEAIVRRVLQPGTRAVDAFPDRVTAAVLAEPPFFQTMQSDLPLWWMQAWLVARGAEDPGPWFADLLRTLEEEAILADGRLPGGYFADTLVQTAAAILAVLEGAG